MRYTIDKAKVKGQILESIVPKMANIGERTRDFIRGITPKDTRKLERSEHWQVVSPDGEVLAGETTDGNGNPVPTYGGNGTLRVIVATNEGADDGKFYGHFPEYGTRGEPGEGFFARGYDAMREIADSEFRS